MNIMFINPPDKSEIQEFLGAHAPLLGFGSMSYQLEREGHSIEILDCPTLGLNLFDAAKFVGKVDPDVIGLTSSAGALLFLEIYLQLASFCPKNFLVPRLIELL